MTDPLVSLSLAAARACIGTEFRVRTGAGDGIVLRLAAVEPLRRDPGAPLAGDRPFSLLFHGPLERTFGQGACVLDHPDLPLPGIFLVPVGQDARAAHYEAVFA